MTTLAAGIARLVAALADGALITWPPIQQDAPDARR